MSRLIKFVVGARVLLYIAIGLVLFVAGRETAPKYEYVPRELRREVIRDVPAVRSASPAASPLVKSLKPGQPLPAAARHALSPSAASSPAHPCSIGGSSTETFAECIAKQARK